jgi:RNA polymerase sigma-70 factor, ECF subfamily
MSAREPEYECRGKEFVSLFQRHERTLLGYILSLVPNLAAADEISQDTTLRLWEQFDQFDPSTDFAAWACTIAYYQVLTYRRKAGRERVRFDTELLKVIADRVAVRHDELDIRQTHLVDCLTQLSEFKRNIIRLYYYLGMNVKAVAEKLGRNVTAVEKTLTRARHTLHDCIEAAIRREEHP